MNVSTLEVLDIATRERQIVFQTARHIEAPNWSPDGRFFVLNSNGLLYRLAVDGGELMQIDTGELHRLNNDHGISPDGTMLAVSDQSHPDGQSRIYVLPIGGGTPRIVTEKAPSYWHGWSPDGATLAFVGSRGGSDLDIYTVPMAGGAERRLTSAAGLDDGPDYSPDGRTIYFNAMRTGNMKIWRMAADGSDQRQMTFDPDTRDWFAHPSPDGKCVVFLSFGSDVAPGDHPPNKDISLRLMPVSGGKPEVIASLFGGQGTMNVPSWSPDSRNVAFVSYCAPGS